MILFSTAKPSSVLRQLTHSCPDGKPSGHSLSSLRRQLERLVEKMRVRELTCLSLKSWEQRLRCPQAKSSLHKQFSCLLADFFLPSFLSGPWQHDPMHRPWSYCRCTIQRWISSSLDNSMPWMAAGSDYRLWGKHTSGHKLKICSAVCSLNAPMRWYEA